eukprot:GCRY01002662.1.p1 GENE.GCRY01002662.1~~GCRY01002662.1.p1  ORF type:complete len:716 (-),score=198.86 GCRY01002662.1:316-2358(-)
MSKNKDEDETSRRFLPLMLFFIQHTGRIIRRAKLNFCLGFMSCFLVVSVVALTMSVLSQTPVVFLALAEADGGQIDLRMQANSWTGQELLNFTKMDSFLNEQGLSKQSPRLFEDSYMFVAKRCTNDVYNTTVPLPPEAVYSTPADSSCVLSPSDRSSNCLAVGCADPVSIQLLAIDFETEKDMGLGRNFPYGPPANLSCYLYDSLANTYDVAEGDVIYLEVDLLGSLEGMTITLLDNLLTNTTIHSLVYIPLFVEKIYDDNKGKYGNDNGEVVMVDYTQLHAYLLRYIHPDTEDVIVARLRSLTLFDYVPIVAINIASDRTEAYLSSDFNEILSNVLAFSSAVVYACGYHNVASSLPILQALEDYQYFSLFLGLLFSLIIIILVFLSIMMIYSLLLVNVETRRFELGAFRMLGLHKGGVALLTVIQAMYYAIPAVVFGLSFAQIIYILLMDSLSGMLGVDLPSGLSAEGIIIAVLLGIFIPLLASLLPVREALTVRLQDALDTRHSKTQAVKVKLERSEGTAVSWNMVVVGAFMAVFGAGVYYGFPLALLSMNFAVMLQLFFLLLLAMLTGLVLLSINIQHILERLAVAVFLCFDTAAIRRVVVKNLVVHRVRNRKTSIMYSLSLGFIIFISVSFRLQIQSFVYSTERENGVPLKVPPRAAHLFPFLFVQFFCVCLTSPP